MVDTAELEALAVVVTDDGGLDLERVDPARDDVHLHQEGVDPEGVDHVRRVQVELDRLVDRQHQRRAVDSIAHGVDVVVVAVVAGGRVRGGRATRFADAVVERPLPLLADDLDGHVGLRIELDQLVLDVDGPVEEDDHHHDRGDRVEDLERQVVARLHGDLVVVAAAVLHHDPEDQAPDDDAGDHRGDPGPLPQLESVGRLCRGRLGHRKARDLVLVSGIACAQEEQGRCEERTHGKPAHRRGCTLGELQTHERASL